MKNTVFSRYKRLSKYSGVVLLAAFLALILGLYVDQPMLFINIPGLLIVLGGTVVAMFMSYPMNSVLDAFKKIHILVEADEQDVSKEMKQVLHFSILWFRNQAALIDRDLDRLDNTFLKTGLQMVRDRQPQDEVFAHLNRCIAQVRSNETALINMYRSMANYAPAFGLLGAFLGLATILGMMEGATIGLVSSHIGQALITSFYGILLANLVFKPAALKLEQKRHFKITRLTLLAEGVMLIQQQRTPAQIKELLSSFVNDSMQMVMSEENTPAKAKAFTAKLSL